MSALGVIPAARAEGDALGLSETEAGRRLAARGRPASSRSSRSYTSIVVANVATLFNAILAAFAVLTLAFGDPRDSLFLGIVVANAAIGIVQEVRAKRTLDRLSALVAPTATVVRDEQPRQARAEAVVPGDLVLLAPGDQLVADGTLVGADFLRLDESILTGESEPVPRGAGDDVRAGSFVVEGTGRCTVTGVGEHSYAERLAGQARAFRHPRSPLELALNRLLLALAAAMVPLGLVLGLSLVLRDASLAEAVPKATAAMVSLVPEGLVLLASLTFAVAAIRMARAGALAQQLNAIESLASADVICLDKTGTLTEATLRVVEWAPAPGVPAQRLEDALGRYAAAAGARNLTLEALARDAPRGRELPLAEVPFASRRRWSALELEDGVLVLGAPELLAGPALATRAAAEAGAGRRVVALAEAPPGLAGHDPEVGPPPGTRPLGLAVLAERLRPDARETVAFLRREGVELKVLSGDAPATAAAIARDAGLDLGDGPVDGRTLPAEASALRDVALGASVIGRISPEDKRRVVEALRDAGRYVAMVGDGVNDVPALKAARLAIAQGSGAQMAKSVADIVLLSGDFAVVPGLVAEGRRILRNVQRVAKLFVAKAAFAAFVILAVGTTSAAYPFLPRHLTVASTLGVGVPAFFLALAPSSGPFHVTGFLRAVARFALPAGLAVGVGVVGAYLAALRGLGFSVAEARTVATTVLLAGLLSLIVALERHPARRRHRAELLALVMAAGYAVVLLVPVAREFFALVSPDPAVLVVAAAGSLATAGLAGLALRVMPAAAEPAEPAETAEAAEPTESARTPEPTESAKPAEPAPHLTLTRRRVVVLALVVPLTGAVLYGLLPRLTGLDDTWGRLERGQPSWLGVALVCEVLSFASYVVLFRGVFARNRRIGWGASFEISLAGVAATRLLAAGGAGGVAVTVWALRRAGLGARRVGTEMSALLALLYGVYMAALVIGGFGLHWGVFAGPDPVALTLVPAAFALAAVAAALALALLPAELGRRVAHRGMGRLAGLPATFGAGVRRALALARRRNARAAGALGWWAFDVAALWACLHAFGEAPAVAVVTMAYFLGLFGNLLPLPGGVGGVEGGMIAALVGFGVPGGLAIVGVLAYRALSFWLPTLIGMVAYGLLLHRVHGWERDDEDRAQAMVRDPGSDAPHD